MMKNFWLFGVVLIMMISITTQSSVQKDKIRIPCVLENTPCPKWVVYTVASYPWQRKEYEYRIPIIIYDPQGLDTMGLPLTIRVTSPFEINSKSAVLVSLAGADKPVQLEKVGEKTWEITFFSDCPPNTWRAHYLYFGKQREKREPFLSDKEIDFINIITGKFCARFSNLSEGSSLTHLSVENNENLLKKNTLSMPATHKRRIIAQGPIKTVVAQFSSVSKEPMGTVEFYQGLPLLLVKQKEPISLAVDLSRGKATILRYISNGTMKEMEMDFLTWNYGPTSIMTNVDLTGLSYGCFELDGERGKIGFIFDQKKAIVKISQCFNGQILSFSPSDGEQIELVIIVNSDTWKWYKRITGSVTIVTTGIQEKKNFPLERRPVFGQDFLVGDSFDDNMSALYVDPEQQIIEGFKTLGINWVGLWSNEDKMPGKKKPDRPPSNNYDFGEMVNIFHRHNMSVMPIFSPKTPDEIIKGSLKYPIDAIQIADEASYKGDEPVVKTAYKQKFGRDIPDKMDFDLLKLKTDLFTEHLRLRRQEISKMNPNIKVYADFSPAQLLLGQWYPLQMIDLDGIAESGVEINIDPYFSDDNQRRFHVRFQSASMGNRGSMNWIGDSIAFSASSIRRQALLGTLFGCRGVTHFCFWGLDFKSKSEFEILRDTFWQLRGTLGDLIMKTEEVKYAAIYWDKTSWWEYLKKNDPSYDREIVNYGHLKSVPWHYLFSRFINDLKNYKILIMPQSEYYDAKTINAALKFARDGGILVLSGTLINYPELRTALRIKNVSMGKQATLETPYGQLPFGQIFNLELDNSSTSVNVICKAKENNAPLVIESSVEHGKIIYFAFNLAESLVAKKLNNFIRDILAEYVQPPVLTKADIETVLLKGENFYLLGIHNYGTASQVEISLKELFGNYRLFDCLNAEEITISGTVPVKFTVFVTPGEIKFFSIGSAENTEILPLSLSTHIFTLTNIKQFPERTVSSSIKPEPKFSKEKREYLIGLISGGTETEGYQDALTSLPGYRLVTILPKEILPDVLSSLDVLIFPGNIRGIETAPRDWVKTVRQYVEEGGSVLLTHDAAGGRIFQYRLFPEIATGEEMVGFKEQGAKSMIVRVSNNFIVNHLKEKMVYRHPYWDHFILQVGNKGEVLLNDGEGYPVFVIGSLGKGKVVVSGFLLCYDRIDEREGPMAPREQWITEILRKTIIWLTETNIINPKLPNFK